VKLRKQRADTTTQDVIQDFIDEQREEYEEMLEEAADKD
jgi:ferritin